MRWLAIAILLCPLAVLAAQRRAAKPKPAQAPASAAWPIETVEIEGNHDYTREQILAVAGVEVGRIVTPKEIDAARQRLLDSGAFQSVAWKYVPAPDAKGFALTFQVKEAEPLFPVRFEELPAKAEEMAAALKKTDPLFGGRIPATEPVLDRYQKTLQAFLATKNYTEPVAAKLLPDDAGQLAVVFRPAAGLPAVSRVKFTGNQVLPASALENAINPVAIGFPYKESRFRQLLDTSVRPLYELRGRVRVAFPEIRTERDPDVKGVIVTVKVEEGESYSLGTVTVDGAEVPGPTLVKLGEWKKGEVFNVERIQGGIARMEKRVRRDGYMHVTSKTERVVDDKTRTVNLKVHITPGARYQFGKLDIQGLDIVTEPAIRKMWGLKTGAPFDADYPDSFLKDVRDQGILDNLGETKAQLKPDDAAHMVDVVLVFKGAPVEPKKPVRNW